MKHSISPIFVLFLSILLVGCGSIHNKSHNINPKKYYEKLLLFPPGVSLAQKVDMASRLIPSPSQLAWQRNELTAFIHFGMNTFTGKEWGDGNEDPRLFNPAYLDADQWTKSLKYAGFKMVILTAKHHDGFCLWPTKTTKHSVSYSPWLNGKGDVVKALSNSCHKHGLKFGIYLSPWDRNSPLYGQGDAYNNLYISQLKELLTNYGKIDEVWLDGANGEGPNGKKQIYDWRTVEKTVHSLQPDAVIAVTGSDVRWVGNENGNGRSTEWSATVLPPETMDSSDSIKHFLGITVKSGDLGSRKLISRANEMYWYPSEVDVSIRPGWFYHVRQDKSVKSLSDLVNIYFKSVGMNSVLLLNVPPDKNGRFSPVDVKRLHEFGEYLRKLYRHDAASRHSLKEVHRGGKFFFDIDLNASQPFDVICLGEEISKGQRIEAFHVLAKINGRRKKICNGTTIGNKRMLLLDHQIQSSQLRVVIDSYRGEKPLLSKISACLRPNINEDIREHMNEHLTDFHSGWIMIANNPLTIDLRGRCRIARLIYYPSDNISSDQIPSRYQLYISDNAQEWKPVIKGEFGNIVNNPIPQEIILKESVSANYIKLVLMDRMGILVKAVPHQVAFTDKSN